MSSRDLSRYVPARVRRLGVAHLHLRPLGPLAEGVLSRRARPCRRVAGSVARLPALPAPGLVARLRSGRFVRDALEQDVGVGSGHTASLQRACRPRACRRTPSTPHPRRGARRPGPHRRARAGDLPARRGSLRRPARPRATRDHHRARARRRNARRPPRRDRVRRARGDLRAPRRSTPTTPPGPLELAHRPPLGRARAHPDAGDTQPPADLFLDVSCELGVLPLVIRGWSGRREARRSFGPG
jgi:hypothetical protein